MTPFIVLAAKALGYWLAMGCLGYAIAYVLHVLGWDGADVNWVGSP